MNCILLTILCLFSLSTSDCSNSYMHNKIARFEVKSDLSSRDTYSNFPRATPSAEVAPNMQLDPFSNPIHQGLTIQSRCTVVPNQALFIAADKLFYSGDKVALKAKQQELNSWKSTLSSYVYAGENTSAAKYIKSLLESQHLDMFVKLRAAPPEKVRPVLKEIFDSTQDPMIRLEAAIQADKMIGDVIRTYGADYLSDNLDPNTFSPTLDFGRSEAIDLKLATRLSQYKIDKITPHDMQSCSAEMRNFTRELSVIVYDVPESIRKPLIAYAVQGFVDKVAIEKDYFDKIREVTFALYDNILVTHLRPEEYKACKDSELGKLWGEVSYAIKGYSQKDWAQIAGNTVAQRTMEAIALKDTQPVKKEVSGFSKEHGIFCDVSITPEIQTDFCGHDASKIINISPEIDALVQERLSQLSSNEIHTLNQLSDGVGAILFEMHQAGELTPANQATFTEKLQSLRASISKIKREDIEYCSARIATSSVNYLSDPIGIVTDRVKFSYAVGHYLCDVYLGQYYMSEQQQLEHFESTLKAFTETIDGLKNITSDQALDLIGIVAADITVGYGACKAVAYLREIGAVSRFSKEFSKTASSLERQFAQPSKKLATAEGILLDCPKELSVKPLALQKASALKNKAESIKGISKVSKSTVKSGCSETAVSSTTFRNKVSQLHPSLAKNVDSIEILEKQVAKLSKKLPQKNVKELLTMETPFQKILKLETEMGDFYTKIRCTNDDILAIAKNTGIDKNMIQRIKSHVFLEKHILAKGIRNFDPDINMARAWQRLIDNKYVGQDLLLLQHEFAESLIMEGITVPWNKAHDVVNQVYNWQNTLL